MGLTDIFYDTTDSGGNRSSFFNTGGDSLGGSDTSGGGIDNGNGSTSGTSTVEMSLEYARKVYNDSNTANKFSNWFISEFISPLYPPETVQYPQDVRDLIQGLTFNVNGNEEENWVFARQTPKTFQGIIAPITQQYATTDNGYFTEVQGVSGGLNGFKNVARLRLGSDHKIYRRMLSYESRLFEILNEDADPPPLPEFGKAKVFKKLTTDNIIRNSIINYTKGLWANGSGSLSTFATSSTQDTTSKTYYYNVTNVDDDECNIFSAFDVTFGHYNGSGSYNGGGDVSDSPSKAIYSQYRLKCLDENTSKFTFNGSETDYIYVINFDRARMKDKIDPGNFQINLSELSGSSDLSVNTGSNITVATGSTVISLIDDSSQSSTTRFSNVYNIVSGTMNEGINSNDVVYGQVYVDLGAIILDGRMLDASASFGTVTGSNQNGDNAYKLFTSISGSSTTTNDRTETYDFIARSIERKTKSQYFLDVGTTEFNFSDNPTFANPTNGDFTQQSFVNDPKTYVTTVGLYNNRYELLAVAKINQAIQKNYQEALKFQINLEY